MVTSSYKTYDIGLCFWLGKNDMKKQHSRNVCILWQCHATPDGRHWHLILHKKAWLLQRRPPDMFVNFISAQNGAGPNDLSAPSMQTQLLQWLFRLVWHDPCVSLQNTVAWLAQVTLIKLVATTGALQKYKMGLQQLNWAFALKIPENHHHNHFQLDSNKKPVCSLAKESNLARKVALQSVMWQWGQKIVNETLILAFHVCTLASSKDSLSWSPLLCGNQSGTC